MNIINTTPRLPRVPGAGSTQRIAAASNKSAAPAAFTASAAPSAFKDGPPVFTHVLAPDLRGGVLRRRFSGVNDAVSFTHAKLHPIALPGAAGATASKEKVYPSADATDAEIAAIAAAAAAVPRRWAPTCERHDLLLPASAPDLLFDIGRLVTLFEQQARVDQRDLLFSLKFIAPHDEPLHVHWERCRAFAATAFVEEEGLPTILALHVPSRAGAARAAPPHIHLLALARRLEPAGFTTFSTRADDDGLLPIAADWEKHRG